jgi:hypothetical protein
LPACARLRESSEPRRRPLPDAFVTPSIQTLGVLNRLESIVVFERHGVKIGVCGRTPKRSRPPMGVVVRVLA